MHTQHCMHMRALAAQQSLLLSSLYIATLSPLLLLVGASFKEERSSLEASTKRRQEHQSRGHCMDIHRGKTLGCLFIHLLLTQNTIRGNFLSHPSRFLILTWILWEGCIFRVNASKCLPLGTSSITSLALMSLNFYFIRYNPTKPSN